MAPPASSAEPAGNLKPCLSVRRSTTAAVALFNRLALPPAAAPALFTPRALLRAEADCVSDTKELLTRLLLPRSRLETRSSRKARGEHRRGLRSLLLSPHTCRGDTSSRCSQHTTIQYANTVNMS